MPSAYAVTPLARLRARAEWRYGTLHSKPHAQLYWFTRGQGRFTIGAVTRGYGPNTAVFIPARVMMSLDLSPQAQGVLVKLPMDPTLGLPGNPFHIRVATVEAQSALSSYFDMIERELAGFETARDHALRAWALLISVWITDTGKAMKWCVIGRMFWPRNTRPCWSRISAAARAYPIMPRRLA